MLKKLSMNRFFISALIISMVCVLFPSTALAATKDEADDIKYSTNSNKALDLDEDDFNDACDDLTGEELDYVKFDLPDDDDGILYYDYDEDEDEDDNTKVTATKKYYFENSPYLSEVSLVPDEDYSGTLTIDYTGYDTDGNSYTGEIKIAVSESSSKDTFTYSISSNKKVVDFDEDDFSEVCEEVQDEDLDYVKFTSLPDDDDGILYYDYDEDEDDNTKITSSKKYYYDETPYLSKITFVPDKDFDDGTITIKYTGYDTDGDDYTGKIKITVGDKDDTDTNSSSDKVVSYKTDDNDKVIDFDKDDFNDACNEINDKDLDYVKFTIPSATKGVLYYNYKNGQYSSIVSSGDKYYYEQSKYISNVTFVPDSDFLGMCKITYTGYDVKGESYAGTVSITVGTASSQTAAIVTYTSKVNTATTFKDEDFNTVCKKVMNAQLSYVNFTLPSTASGTLYYGYTAGGDSGSKIKSSTKYYYGGSPYLLNVTFVPADNVTGTVTIAYTGYDLQGASYSGKVQINISSSSTPTPTPTPTPIDTSKLVSSKYFKDVDISYSWAVPYIDSLYESNIISGTTSGNGSKLYSPAASVTRGDFMLILYKALNLQTSSIATGFSDVPSDSYYYKAITTAKALGIAQGQDNRFYPGNSITREDAMVFALRAVNITGKTIASGDTSSLSKYGDGSSISEYSKSAVASLVKAGLITGSDDNKIYPQGSLSRAQTAAIIYRIKNM